VRTLRRDDSPRAFTRPFISGGDPFSGPMRRPDVLAFSFSFVSILSRVASALPDEHAGVRIMGMTTAASVDDPLQEPGARLLEDVPQDDPVEEHAVVRAVAPGLVQRQGQPMLHPRADHAGDLPPQVAAAHSIVQSCDIEEVLSLVGGDVAASLAIGIDDNAAEVIGLVGVVGALPLAGLREVGAELDVVELVAADGDLGAVRLLLEVVG